MRELRHTLHAFVDALHRKEPVFLTPQGYWRIENWFDRGIRRLFGLEVYAQIELVRSCISVLDQLESLPVNFSRIPGVGVSQPVDFHGYLSVAQSVQHAVGPEKDSSLKALLDQLKMRTLALLYRLEEENGGLHLTEKRAILLGQVLARAEKWKKNEKVFWSGDVSEGERREISESVKYAEFVKYLLVDESLANDFFTWVLRDALPADVYIQFPALREKITSYNLRGRLGRMGQGFLCLRKVDHRDASQCQQKVVTLPFEGREISLLDEKQIVIFRGNYKASIKQVMQVFRDKPKDLGNFEIFAQGVLNWNSNCMGWWNNDLRAYELIDLNNPYWWRQLPVLEVLSQEEASKRFRAELDGSRWILAAKSAREYITLDYDRCHAYIEMAIPTPDRQFYIIYTFGKAAVELPRNSWHRLFMFGAHVPATIVYPDENMYFTHRQQIGYIFELTEGEGSRLMDAFKEDILRARKGNMVFQIEAENCGKWIQNHLEAHLGPTRVPNLYRFPVLEAEPNGMMARFFGFFKSLPQFCRTYLFILIHYPLGAWRGRWVVDDEGQKVWKSLTSSSFWKDAVTYLPAYLHKQHEIGVFADDPVRHKIWVEASSVEHKKNHDNFTDQSSLFEDDKNRSEY